MSHVDFAAPSETTQLLLRETNHRCANDLQLVVSLLALQSRRVSSDEARAALHDAMDRVAVLAQARAAMLHPADGNLEAALRQTCEALSAQAEPRSILLAASFGHCPDRLSADQITAIALAVNELATNAIKHAFQQREQGKITISVDSDGESIVVTVDDDGLPLPEPAAWHTTGLGLGLVERLLASIGGHLKHPQAESKSFRIEVPAKETTRPSISRPPDREPVARRLHAPFQVLDD